MIRFNLLPYRAQGRRRAQRRFCCMLVLAGLLGAALTAIALYAGSRQRAVQQARNDWLRQARATLEQDIRRAAALHREAENLLAAARRIERLRHDGERTGRLLALVAASVPPEAYLRKLERREQRVVLDGYAASNQTVSDLLQALGRRGGSVAKTQLIETRIEKDTLEGRAGSANEAEHPAPDEALAFGIALTLEDAP